MSITESDCGSQPRLHELSMQWERALPANSHLWHPTPDFQ